MSSQRQKFHEMIKGIGTATMITHEIGGGNLGVRPMSVARINEDCDLWFFTSLDSSVVSEIRADDRMSISMQDGEFAFYVMSGIAKVSTNREQIHKLWKEPYKVWFPKGPDDPDICIIHFDSKNGEYWDTQGVNKVKYLFEAAKAYVTGEKAQTEEGEHHGNVEFS